MKKRRKKIIKVLFYSFSILFLLIISALCAAYYYLPYLIEKEVVPYYAPLLGLKNVTLMVNRADINGLDISSLAVSDGTTDGLKISHIRLTADGSRLSSVDLKGLDLFFRLKNNQGLLIPGIMTDRKKTNDTYTIPSFLTRSFSLAVHGASITLEFTRKGKKYRIKVPYSITLIRKGNDILFFTRQTKTCIKYGTTKISLVSLKISGRIIPKDNRVTFSGQLELNGADITTSYMKAEGIKASIPFTFNLKNNALDFSNPPENLKSGTIRVKRIIVQKRNLGSLNLKTLQEKDGFKLTGSLDGYLKDRKLAISAFLTPPSADKVFSIEIHTEADWRQMDRKLSELWPGLPDINFKGNLALSADATIDYRGFKNKVAVKINDASIEDSINKLSVNGIKLEAVFDDITNVRTLPSQLLTFTKADISSFKLNSGKVRFRLESADSIFIEQSTLKWCNGSVGVNAFRIDTKNPGNIEALLYCNRLNVAAILNQFGIGKASGKGNVSGRIPIIFKNNNLQVNDGFLYSEPGEEGIISLTDFLGPLSKQSAGVQMDIARAALEKFRYKWMKIRLNSEKNELLLVLEMDGAPSELLPFGFDMEKGGIYKSQGPDASKADFKGIAFKINFRLPANKILSYKKGVDELMKNIK